MEAKQLLQQRDWLYTKFITEDLKNSEISVLTGVSRKRDKIKLLIDDIVQTYGIINHKRWG